MIASQELVEVALASSQADGCIVLVEEHSEVHLRWAANAVTASGTRRGREVTVIAVDERPDGLALGICTVDGGDGPQVRELARAADRSARDSEPLADWSPLVCADSQDPTWDLPVPQTGPDGLTPLAGVLGSICRRWASGGRELSGYAEHKWSARWLGVSTGVRCRFDQPDGRLELTGKPADHSHSTWIGRHLPDVADAQLEAAAAELERALEWGRTRVDLPAGRYETLLPPAAVADLMLCLYRQLAARDAIEGRSAFASRGSGNRIGEQVSPLPLTLYSDPAVRDVACAPFALVTAESALGSVLDNGLPIERTEWVRQGRLAELIRTRAVARRSGGAPRPYVENLILDCPGSATIEEMVRDTERGLLLTGLWYIRDVDLETLLVTGLTRDGVYLVEDGRVRAAVNNFRFNESPLDLLGRATEIGGAAHTLPRERSDAFTRTMMAPLRVPDFRMSSVSDSL